MDLTALNSYTGEYMSQYEWGEFVLEYLNQQKHGVHKMIKKRTGEISPVFFMSVIIMKLIPKTAVHSSES